MPYSRKRLRSRSRSVRRYVRRYGRRPRKYLRKSKINRSVTYHWYRRTVFVEDIQSTALTGVHKAFAFNLGMLGNVSDFTNLYDAYKIKKIIIRIEPTTTSIDLVNVTNVGNIYIRACHDYDDNSALTNEGQYLEYQNCKSYPAVGTRPIRITLYPKIAGMIYRTGVTTGYSQIRPVFLDCSQTDINHFGVKVFFPDIGRNGYTCWRVYATYIMCMKDSR